MKELTQIVIEDKYSKRKVRHHIMKELVSYDEGEFGCKIDTACQAIQVYLRGSYYPSKEARISHLYEIDLSIDDIVFEILMIVLPTTDYLTIQSVSGQLAGKLGYPNIFDGIKTAAELITVVCGADLFNIIKPEASVTGSALVENIYVLSDELMQYIANVKYLPPMVCKPKILKTNWDCAHLTGTDSLILKGNTHEGKQSLDVLNIRNQTALSLDLRILKLKEMPKSDHETVKQAIAFERMAESSRIVYMDLIDEDNKFYLPHKLDQRGRGYAQGYHCNYQSSQYKKALINLHKKELIV
jgi:hypothetical protein